MTASQSTQNKKHQHKHKLPRKKNTQGKSTFSSLPGPALKPATLEMMRKEEGKKKKEEKEKLKKQQKEERRQQYHKGKEQKEKEEAKKQYFLRRILFLCLKRTMRKMIWRMILWFSQTLPPVITSLKAHFYDYQHFKQWRVSI